MADEKSDGGGVTRLSFIKASAGAAAGMAAVGVPAAVALSGEQREVATPSADTPREPLIAYVRDAERGEVTVMAGTHETTYRDRALVKRLLAAAPERSLETGGGFNVITP